MANTITLNPIPQQTVGAAGATVSGTWTPSAIAKPTLQVQIGAGALGPLPAGATVPAAPSLPAESFSFQIPSFTAAGTFAVLVSDGTVSASVNVVVVAAGANSTPDNTFITTVGPVIWDTRSPPHSWALKDSGGTKQLQITENGAVRAETNNVTILGRTTGPNIHQFGGGSWWGIDTSKSTVGDVWFSEADPRPTTPGTVTNITLSNLTVTAGQPAGTVVGNIGVVMSSGSFTGTMSITGADATSFKIVGSQLQTNAILVARNYAINLNTLLNGATVSRPFTIVVASASAGTVTDITLSNTTIAANQPAGTVVGQIGITMSSGTFPASGTIALSGAQAARFSINPAKQLVTASSRPAETDAITITTTI